MTTIKDVAKLAGVSVSTASYALNGKGNVKPETKMKVLEAAKQLNYQKNGLAMDLKKSKTKTIALILSDLSGPYYSELIKGVQEVTMANGYDLIACSSIGGKDSTAIKFLTEKRVDGVIILAHNISDEVIMASSRDGFPIIVLDRFLEDQHIISVLVNNTQGAYQATKYLIEQGHRDIAFISGPSNSVDSINRMKGYQQALEEYDIAYQSKWTFTGNFTREGGYHATKLLIMQGDLPTAVFYANDEMALGGYQAFEEMGIKIPDDISVMGFDDIQIAQYLNPPLTTVKQPKYEAGTLAAHLLFQAFDNQEINRRYDLSTDLVIRGSVAKPQNLI
ncbi:LacI family DNA-binding transcriptional regulator [Caldalkalibacillus uzonensis]|nr:LacI family DNA-binding transcriptional regulator [Caldalkalibacillus uzonensis]